MLPTIAQPVPHPIMRPSGSDYARGALKCDIRCEPAQDGTHLRLVADFWIKDNETISELVRQVQAVYCVLVKDSRTFYQRVFLAEGSRVEAVIDADLVSEKIEVRPHVVAIRHIRNLGSPHFLGKNRGRIFDLIPGAILGTGGPVTLAVDVPLTIHSIFRVCPWKMPDGTFHYQADPDFLTICLSKKDFATYRSLQDDQDSMDVFTAGVCLPVLVEALRKLDADPGTQYQYRWADVLAGRIHKLGLDEIGRGKDRLQDAQLILSKPMIALWKHDQHRIGNDEGTSLPYLTDNSVNRLLEDVPMNRGLYFSRNPEWERVKGWQVHRSRTHSRPNLKLLRKEVGDDIKAALRVYREMRFLAPREAIDRRIWIYLCHSDGFEYAQTRWLLDSDGGTEKEQVAKIEDHFFLGDHRALRRNNALSRLWWLGHFASQVDPENPERVLHAVVHLQDIRGNLIERPGISMSIEVARTIVDRIERSRKENDGLVIRRNFRAWMKVLTQLGKGHLLECLDECDRHAIFEEAARYVLGKR